MHLIHGYPAALTAIAVFAAYLARLYRFSGLARFFVAVAIVTVITFSF